MSNVLDTRSMKSGNYGGIISLDNLLWRSILSMFDFCRARNCGRGGAF